MPPISLAEINANNQAFWNEKCADQHELLQRRYIRCFIRARFCDPTAPSFCIAPGLLQHEPSFYAQLCARKEGFSSRQQAIAGEPRRKALGNGRSRRELVRDFASSPEMALLRTKALWKLFFTHLKSLGLNPTVADSPHRYEYEGKKARISITFRQFENLVSELAPRRKKR